MSVVGFVRGGIVGKLPLGGEGGGGGGIEIADVTNYLKAQGYERFAARIDATAPGAAFPAAAKSSNVLVIGDGTISTVEVLDGQVWRTNADAASGDHTKWELYTAPGTGGGGDGVQTYDVADEAARDALVASTGDLAHVQDVDVVYRWDGAEWDVWSAASTGGGITIVANDAAKPGSPSPNDAVYVADVGQLEIFNGTVWVRANPITEVVADGTTRLALPTVVGRLVRQTDNSVVYRNTSEAVWNVWDALSSRTTLPSSGVAQDGQVVILPSGAIYRYRGFDDEYGPAGWVDISVSGGGGGGGGTPTLAQVLVAGNTAQLNIVYTDDAGPVIDGKKLSVDANDALVTEDP